MKKDKIKQNGESKLPKLSLSELSQVSGSTLPSHLYDDGYAPVEPVEP